MSMLAVCDGPSCTTTAPYNAAADWISIHGIDIDTVQCCSLPCAAAYLATCVSAAPLDQPDLFHQDALLEPPC